ncbi:spore coat protein GerQ [Heliobacterium chlorum]|nr:spore coat protein GerQ [Heliobacterium chlorum]
MVDKERPNDELVQEVSTACNSQVSASNSPCGCGPDRRQPMETQRPYTPPMAYESPVQYESPTECSPRRPLVSPIARMPEMPYECPMAGMPHMPYESPMSYGPCGHPESYMSEMHSYDFSYPYTAHQVCPQQPMEQVPMMPMPSMPGPMDMTPVVPGQPMTPAPAPVPSPITGPETQVPTVPAPPSGGRIPGMTQPGMGEMPGMLPAEQSYIENILRLNRGRVATVYMTFENNEQWNAKIFRGVIEAAGRDHLILSDPRTGRRYLLKMINVDYVTFDEPIAYSYPFNGRVPLDTTSPR